jgi:hypothetical protein
LLLVSVQVWQGQRLVVHLRNHDMEEQCIDLPAVPEGTPVPFGLAVDKGTVLVDDVVLYCHTEQQGVYDITGAPLALAGAVRDMNTALPEESGDKLWA